MARGLLINETFLKSNSEVDENVDMKVVNPVIWYSQKAYIEPVIGTVLYDDLISKIVAGSLAGNDLTLVNDYIADALLYWVMYELQVPLTFKFRNKSVSKNTDANSQPVDFEQHKYLKDIYRPKAQYFTERLDKYLCANSDLFPLYNTSTDDDDLLPKNIPPQVSVYLGGKRIPKLNSNGYYCD